MFDLELEIIKYVERIEYPVSKEEIINGLLADNAPAYEVALVDRLPHKAYESSRAVLGDLAEVTRIHGDEIQAAQSYEDYLQLVIRHVGDVAHATKEVFNATAARIVRMAERMGKLTDSQAREIELRLDAAFANLRGSMSTVTDDSAPTDPREDLPRLRS